VRTTNDTPFLPRRITRALLAALAVAASCALAACGSSDNGPSTATPIPGLATSAAPTRTPSGAALRTPTTIAVAPTVPVTVVAITPGASLPVRPPTARATAGSSSIDLTRGSFIWNGVQADAVHVITSTNRLIASPGATIVVPNPAPLPLATVAAGFVPATDRPTTTEAGMLEWPYGAFTRDGVATLTGEEADLTAPTEPGTYVGTLLLQYIADASGVAPQAYYHFLLEVQ
jgi:hypothetical protein